MLWRRDAGDCYTLDCKHAYFVLLCCVAADTQLMHSCMAGSYELEYDYKP